MLKLQDVTKSYASGRQVLSGLNYLLGTGEYVAVMGESGVGKSTLLNLIAGLDTPDSGDIVIDGVAMSSLNDDAATRLRREKFGFVFQAFHVLPHLTVAQNVALPLLLNREAPERANQMLAAVGLHDRATDYPRQLSGGELQRVAIARALVHRPKLILADEPTGNLDQETGAHVIELMFRLARERGTSILLITHDPSLAKQADRVLRMNEGHLGTMAVA